MYDNLFDRVPMIKPDRDKILYYTNLCKGNKASLVKSQEMLGMFKYILSNNLEETFKVDLTRLAFIINKLYGINAYKLIKEKGVHND